MNRVIKKNFKCKLCKNKYQITDDMLRTIEIIELCDHPHYNRAFSCPICGQVYAFDTNGFGEYNPLRHMTIHMVNMICEI